MQKVSILATKESIPSTVLGIQDILSTVGIAWNELITGKPGKPLYRPKIVSGGNIPLTCFGGTKIHPHISFEKVAKTDILFIPSLWVPQGHTFKGEYTELIAWITEMYQQGATICSACTGLLLLAETGLLDGQTATTHWAYKETLRQHYPEIDLRPDLVLVQSGDDGRIISSGAHSSWYDLVLHLIKRDGGSELALQTSKIFLIQPQADSQAAYASFQEKLDHGDMAIRESQLWLAENYDHSAPVESAEQLSGLTTRTFKRRFKQATGATPIEYVQKLRIEKAKARLEISNEPVDDISWKVGYEDPAFFRRLFKRTTGLTPSHYRRKFKVFRQPI